ncbi:hypothetical protein D9M71_756010 [compost metagenome]
MAPVLRFSISSRHSSFSATLRITRSCSIIAGCSRLWVMTPIPVAAREITVPAARPTAAATALAMPRGARVAPSFSLACRATDDKPMSERWVPARTALCMRLISAV